LTLVGATIGTAARRATAVEGTEDRLVRSIPSGRFRLCYAPHLGLFPRLGGSDEADQVAFLADQGFGAVEDVGWRARPLAKRRRIVSAMNRYGMTLANFVAWADYQQPSFARPLAQMRERLQREIIRALEVAREAGVRSITVLLGRRDRRIAMSHQVRCAIDNVRFCVELCERAGVTLLIEPTGWPDQWSTGRMLIASVEDADRICRAVASPYCKLVFDVYRERRAGRDPLTELRLRWTRIGAIQMADFPNRTEPGTGVIDFERVFAFLIQQEFSGFIGMDHGRSRPGVAGEWAVLAAYRRLDRTYAT